MPPAERRPAGLIRTSFQRFLATETSGAVTLVLGTTAALVWANSAWSSSYGSVWETSVGPYELKSWINDALMSLFFLVVGLEIKRELTRGELRDRKAAVLPVIGAIGGMVVPAALYVAFNAGGLGGRGWGIPMATDIAFAVGILAFFSTRVPDALKVFLLSLAIVDDIGAILVIAVFYTQEISAAWLLGTSALLSLSLLASRRKIEHPSLWLALGVATWVCLHEAGVHPTLAGVAVGLVMPAAPAERFERVLHPWTSYAIVPLFALANAGIRIDRSALDAAVGSPVTAGIAVGLVLGKMVGVGGSVWIASRRGLPLPTGATWRMMWGVSALAGIGFTVSLFISNLAFGSALIAREATLGILFGSLIAAGLGVLLLASVRRP